jgi:hypothetical protein
MIEYILLLLLILIPIYLLNRTEKLDIGCLNMLNIQSACLKECLQTQCTNTSGNWCALNCLDDCSSK